LVSGVSSLHPQTRLPPATEIRRKNNLPDALFDFRIIFWLHDGWFIHHAGKIKAVYPEIYNRGKAHLIAK
jgi:hypothetical protein